MSPLGGIDGTTATTMRPDEETVVDSSTMGSFTIISLSSVSPVDSETHGPVIPPPPPPVNSPSKTIQVASHGNSPSLDQLLSCFYPLNRLWPFSWTVAQKDAIFPASDSDSENYEIPLECIVVNFKEDYIGGGNQSSVFRGKWRGDWIALKKLNRASEVDIKRLCSLSHPNVIKTFGICTTDIYPCIVMEYCEKGGLFDYLRRTPNISKSLFLRWSIEVATGMTYLHTIKIVHRDLKSPNILVDNRDTLKICDFGSLYSWEQRLNSHNQSITQMSSVLMTVCGTSQWMSPEMMKNEPCNEKVDVWSYGVVLWELLTGEIPYEKYAPLAVCYGVCTDDLRLHTPKTAPDSIKFLLKICWAKRPRNRPSFSSILSSLNNLQAELSEIQESGWTMRREVWRKEIAEKNEKLMLHNSCGGGGDQQAFRNKEEELVQKRVHELRHAQEIRQLYEGKLKKADKLLRKVDKFRLQLEAQAQENERVAAQLSDRSAHNSHWHQLLLEWHAVLGEMEGGEEKSEMDVAEASHIALQAEEAKKASMFLHDEERKEDYHHSSQQFDAGMHRRASAFSLGTERAASLRVTSYGYDLHNRKFDLSQRMLTESTFTNNAKANRGVNEGTSRRKLFDEFGARSLRRRDDYSPCSSGDEVEEEEEYQTLNKDSKRGGSVTKKLQFAAVTSHSFESSDKKQPRLNFAQIESSPSHCSSLANTPSNCSTSFRASEQTAALRSPNIKQTIPHFAEASMSRDDSAISSLFPYSPLGIDADKSNDNSQQQHLTKEESAVSFCSNCKLALSFSDVVRQQEFFTRNSIARASGLSADSGVSQEDDSFTILEHVGGAETDDGGKELLLDIVEADESLTLDGCALNEQQSNKDANRMSCSTSVVLLPSNSKIVSSLERSLEMGVANSDGLSDREAKLREAKTTFKLTHRRTASNPTNFSHSALRQQFSSSSASNDDDEEEEGELELGRRQQCEDHQKPANENGGCSETTCSGDVIRELEEGTEK